MESKISNLWNIINQSKQTKYDDHPLISGKPASAKSKYKTSRLKDHKDEMEKERSFINDPPNMIWEMLSELDIEDPVI